MSGHADSHRIARDAVRTSRLEPASLVDCPHWSPGRVTKRTGCTACAADAARAAEANLSRLLDGIGLKGGAPQ